MQLVRILDGKCDCFGTKPVRLREREMRQRHIFPAAVQHSFAKKLVPYVLVTTPVLPPFEVRSYYERRRALLAMMTGVYSLFIS